MSEKYTPMWEHVVKCARERRMSTLRLGDLGRAIIAADIELRRLRAIVDLIDRRSPQADKTCVEPGITLSEAARRELRDDRHVLFLDDK